MNYVICCGCRRRVMPSHRSMSAGSIVVAALLLTCGILPGLLYAIWHSSRKECPRCGSAL